MNINRKRLLALLGHDEARVERFIINFQTQLPALVQSIRTAFEQQNWETASIHCHDLKNQANYLGLKDLSARAYELELMAEREKLPSRALMDSLL
ncbi:MAG: Hpt domain-containing protein [Bacteroidota bacterium]